MVKNLPAKQQTQVQSLGWEDPLENGMATHSQYSCLEDSMDRGDWWATVHGVSKRQTHNLTVSLLRYLVTTKERIVTVENSGRNHLSQVIKVNIPSNTCEHQAPLHMIPWEVPITSIVFLSQMHNLIESITQTHTEGHSNKISNHVLQKCQDLERNFHRSEETKYKWQLNTMWNLGWDPCTKKKGH